MDEKLKIEISEASKKGYEDFKKALETFQEIEGFNLTTHFKDFLKNQIQHQIYMSFLDGSIFEMKRQTEKLKKNNDKKKII
jgi:hypothetical protein